MGKRKENKTNKRERRGPDGRKISVIIKEPGRPPRHVNISRTLENLQRTVDGPIESVTVVPGLLVVICNEEGRLRGLAPSCVINGIEFCGTAILAGVETFPDGEQDFGDVPMTFDQAKKLFPRMFADGAGDPSTPLPHSPKLDRFVSGTPRGRSAQDDKVEVDEDEADDQ